jgi:hypothetical protein
MFIDTTGDDHAHKYTTVLFSAPVSDLAAGDVVEALVRVGLHNDPNNLRNDGKTKYVFNHLTNVSLILTGSPDDVEPTDPGGNNGATPRYARWMSGDRGMNCPPIGCTRVMGGAIRSDEVPAGKPMYVNAVAIAVEAGNGTSDVKNARLDVTARNGDDNTLVVTCHSTHARGGNPCRPGL